MKKPSPRDEGSHAPRRRFRVSKFILWLLLIPLLFFGVSNLWLNSSWGRGVAEAKLKHRTGMDWQVQGMTWSPWNGFTLRGAKVLQPEALREYLDQPLLGVDSIQVKPYWSQLFRGKVRIREVSMEAPRMTVSVEMLASLASDAVQEQSLPQASSKPQVAKSSAPSKPQRPAKPDAQSGKEKPKPPIAKEKTKPSMVPAKKERPPAGLAMHLLVKNASLRLVSVSKGSELLDVKEVDIDLPILGEDAKGIVKLGKIKMPGLESINDIEQVIVWKRPYLEIEEQAVELADLKVRYIAQLAIARGLPFLFDAVVDPQQLEGLPLLERFAVDLQADKVSGQFKASGALTSPMTWRSSFIAMGEHVCMSEKHSAHRVYFDEVSMPAVFQRGTLRWSSARVIGEDVSILGNGSISVRNGLNAVTRLVASPEIAVELESALIGAKIIRQGPAWWADLGTPDRKFRDLYIAGSLIDPQIDVGTRRAVLPLWQTLAATMNFIRVEMKEEGVNLKAVPNKDLLNKKQHANHKR